MSSSPTDVSTVVDVLMPKMGTSVAEGTVVEWRVGIGDAVEADEPLCTISTDKVDSDCPSPATGVRAEVVVKDGETVDVGTVMGRGGGGGTAATGGGGSPADAGGATAGDGGGAGSASTSADHVDPTRRAPGGSGARREILRRSSPVAAKIAAAHGIDVRRLDGSGRNGRVTKADVLRAIEAGPGSTPSAESAAAEPPMHIESPYRRDPSVPVAGGASRGETAVGEQAIAAERASMSADQPNARRHTAGADPLGGTVVPLDRMRTAIGAQMRKALDTAAHATTIVECDMSRIERERRELGVTALPLVTRHVLDTLREFPALNATYDGETLTRFERVHLGIAVALGDDGLIVPVIHDAQDLSAEGIAHRIKDLAGRARTGELTADEVRGGTFTVTNPGAAGALVATPIINVPQVAILDLEAIVKRPVVVTDEDGQDSIAIRPIAHLCMSWDHRVLDGMYAARFLTALRQRIEGRDG